MFGSPLGWFENTGLSSGYVADAAPMIARWKGERDAMYRGTIVPNGEVPDGRSWTGFASFAEGWSGGYLLVFRKLNEHSTWEAPRSMFASGKYRIQVLGGEGEIKETNDGFEVHIPEQLGFVWARLDAVH
jgi:alpha-galactosidase